MNSSTAGAKGLLHGLTPDELKLLLAVAQRRTIEEGEIILRQGQRHNSLFLIEKGALHVQRASVLLGQISDGGFFGEVGFFVPTPATATVRAVKRGVLYQIRREDFDRFLAQQPVLGCKLLTAILQQLGERLGRADERLVDSICWGSAIPATDRD
jgi:CRP-like cAMP-binding protein